MQAEFERPSQEFVDKIYKQSRIFTAVAVLFCACVYVGLLIYSKGDANITQSRFNVVFQGLLVAAWTWFMFPYIRVTLQMMLYGIRLNEQATSFFRDPENSPLVQYIDKKLEQARKDLESAAQQARLDFQSEAGRIREELGAANSVLRMPLKPPPSRRAQPVAEPIEGAGHEQQQPEASR